MLTKTIVKNHLRIEHTADDTYLDLLLAVAVEYVSGITGVLNNEDAPKTYELACLLLISHWYSNREAVAVGSLNRVPYGFEALLQSIRPASGLF